MILRVVNSFKSCRRAHALVLFTLATVLYGCGSSDQSGANAGKASATIELKPEDDYTYEGTGSAKRKVELSRRERVKRLHEAAKKTE